MFARNFGDDPPRKYWESCALQHVWLPTKNVATSLIVDKMPSAVQRIRQTHCDELTVSIAQFGILSPLIVRPIQDGQYELLNGFGRLMAARSLGIASIPISIYTFEGTYGSLSSRFNSSKNFVPSEVDDYLEYLRVSCKLTTQMLGEDLHLIALRLPPSEYDAELTLLQSHLRFIDWDSIRFLAAYCASNAEIVAAYKSRLLCETDFTELVYGQQPRSTILLQALSRQRDFDFDFSPDQDSAEMFEIRALIDALADSFECMLEDQSTVEQTNFETRMLDAIAYAAKLHEWFDTARLAMIDRAADLEDSAMSQ